MKSVTSNRPLRELVAEAKAEVMEEIEDNREEGEEDNTMELSVVPNVNFFYPSFLSIHFLFHRFVSARRPGSPCVAFLCKCAHLQGLLTFTKQI